MMLIIVLLVTYLITKIGWLRCTTAASHVHNYLKSKLKSKSRLPFPEFYGYHCMYTMYVSRLNIKPH